MRPCRLRAAGIRSSSASSTGTVGEVIIRCRLSFLTCQSLYQCGHQVCIEGKDGLTHTPRMTQQKLAMNQLRKLHTEVSIARSAPASISPQLFCGTSTMLRSTSCSTRFMRISSLLVSSRMKRSGHVRLGTSSLWSSCQKLLANSVPSKVRHIVSGDAVQSVHILKYQQRRLLSSEVFLATGKMNGFR